MKKYKYYISPTSSIRTVQNLQLEILRHNTNIWETSVFNSNEIDNCSNKYGWSIVQSIISPDNFETSFNISITLFLEELKKLPKNSAITECIEFYEKRI